MPVISTISPRSPRPRACICARASERPGSPTARLPLRTRASSGASSSADRSCGRRSRRRIAPSASAAGMPSRMPRFAPMSRLRLGVGLTLPSLSASANTCAVRASALLVAPRSLTTFASAPTVALRDVVGLALRGRRAGDLDDAGVGRPLHLEVPQEPVRVVRRALRAQGGPVGRAGCSAWRVGVSTAGVLDEPLDGGGQRAELVGLRRVEEAARRRDDDGADRLVLGRLHAACQQAADDADGRAAQRRRPSRRETTAASRRACDLARSVQWCGFRVHDRSA